MGRRVLLAALVLAACTAPGSTTPPAGPAPTAPAPQIPDGAVLLEPGDDLDARVQEQPPGTTFVIAAGVHREQHIRARDGDTFLGQPGAVLSGARVLTDVRRDGDRWVAATGPLGEYLIHGQMDAGWEREAYPQDLWIGDERQRHVAALDLVAPGTFYLEEDAGRVVFGTDPGARPVELGVTSAAFSGDGTRDVTITDLEVRRYANPSQRGAIEAFGTQGWTLRRVVTTANHSLGVRLGPGSLLEGCTATDNGQLGVGGNEEQERGERPMVVRDCEIARNGVLGYQWDWEAGATKFVGTTGMRFERNHVHDNRGPGGWWDSDNVDVLVRDNVFERNTLIGVLYEISYAATIEGNIVRDNGRDGYGDIGSGIYVSNSRDVVIRGNLLEHNRIDLLAAQYDRGAGRLGPYDVTGLLVAGNDLTVDGIAPGLRLYEGDPDLLTSGTNRFEGNTWRMAPDTLLFWGRALDVAGWQAVGNDLEGTFTDQSQRGALPSTTR